MKVKRVIVYDGSPKRISDTLSRSLRLNGTWRVGDLSITVESEETLPEDYKVKIPEDEYMKNPERKDQ